VVVSASFGTSNREHGRGRRDDEDENKEVQEEQAILPLHHCKIHSGSSPSLSFFLLLPKVKKE